MWEIPDKWKNKHFAEISHVGVQINGEIGLNKNIQPENVFSAKQYFFIVS
jgi:hypothetical protein